MINLFLFFVQNFYFILCMIWNFTGFCRRKEFQYTKQILKFYCCTGRNLRKTCGFLFKNSLAVSCKMCKCLCVSKGHCIFSSVLFYFWKFLHFLFYFRNFACSFSIVLLKINKNKTIVGVFHINIHFISLSQSILLFCQTQRKKKKGFHLHSHQLFWQFQLLTTNIKDYGYNLHNLHVVFLL